MDNQLLLHDKTRRRISDFLQKPAHALLIYGPAGSGKKTLAVSIMSELINIPVDKFDTHPYIYKLEKQIDKQEISINAVRQVIENLNLKPAITSGGLISKAVLVAGAENLSQEAQNALLKVVEEPPDRTIFIMTAGSFTDILPTIASRTQKIAVAPINLEAAVRFYKTNYPQSAIESAWNLSQGAAGLMQALLKDDKEHPLKQAVDQAKALIKMNQYEKILYLDSLAGKQKELLTILDGLNRVLAALTSSAVSAGKPGQTKKLVTARKLINNSIDRLNKNVSNRLLILDLAFGLTI